MVTLYLDEDVPEAIAAPLRDRGHSVITTREEGRKGAPDYRQLWHAANNRWAIVTHNRKDFIALHGAWLLWSHEWGVQPEHAGVLVLARVPTTAVAQLAIAVDTLVRDPNTRLVKGLYEWRRTAGWRRSPR